MILPRLTTTPPPSDLILPTSAERAFVSVLEGTEEFTQFDWEMLRAFSSFHDNLHLDFWRDGVEPMPFDEWCLMLDGKALTTRQQYVFERAGLLRAGTFFSSKRKVQEVVAVWGKGCLAGDQKIQDQRTGEVRSCEDWARIGTPLLVRSWGGGEIICAPSSPVYQKGIAPIFKITLEDGRSFKATAEHRCLTPRGWAHLGRLFPGDSLLCESASSIPQANLYPRYTGIASMGIVGEEPFYDLTVPGTHCYFDSEGVLHHNSGKGYSSAKFLTWISYIINCMKNDPATYFGLAPRTNLVAMNVAPNEDLARNVFFKYVRGFIAHPIFQQFNPVVTASEVRFPRYDRKQNYAWESLSLYSRHSNASGLDGHNLIAWVMDEADAFEVTDVKCQATIVHDILRSSAATRVRRAWCGLVISYPRSEDGFVLKLRERAIRDNETYGDASTYMQDLAATWEVRPNVSRDDPTIAEDYINDPRGAAGKYECRPVATGDAFIEFPERIEAAIDKVLKPAVVWRPTITQRAAPSGDFMEYVGAQLESVKYVPGMSYYMAADGGLTSDTFSISIMATEQAISVTHVEWLCPDCDIYNPSIRKFSQYRLLPDSEQMTVSQADMKPTCPYCGQEPPGRPLNDGRAIFFIGGWFLREPPSLVIQPFTIGGVEMSIPVIHEAAIITAKPYHKRRVNEKNRPVDLPLMEEVMGDLMERLHIHRARFDPWQLAATAQKLNGKGNCDVQTIPFSQPEQFKRASLAKALLYRNLVRLLPHRIPADGEMGPSHDEELNLLHSGVAQRDSEWMRVQRRGTKIDHPAGGSKDIFDAEVTCIWVAATDQCERIITDWIPMG